MSSDLVLTWRLDYIAFCAALFLVHLVADRWLRSGRGLQGLTWRYWLFLCIVLAAGIFPVELFGKREHEQRRGMLMGIAPTYARELEYLGHADLADDAAPDDPLYLRLIDAEIRWLNANPSVADVYTFRKRGDKVYLVVDSETDYDHSGAYDAEREQRTPIGKQYDPTPGILAAFEGTPAFDGIPVRDEWGTWVSASEPMYDSEGRVEAVLGVDYPAAEWTSAALQARVEAMGTILLIITIASAAMVVFRFQQGALGERLRIEGQLREARDAAEASNTAKSAFLANMSHEIRTPMTAILGYADLLTEPDLSEAVRAEHIQIIRRNGEHLLTVINDILDLSRIEAGKLSLESLDCSPLEILHDVVSLLQVRAAAKSVALELHPVMPLPARIRSDPSRLRQILLNLVGNAIKFTESGSVRIEVKMGSPQGPLAIAISDSGIGMSPQTVESLFRPFTQADSSMSRRFGGSGLGLTISRRLAAMLGGDIAVTSELGKGSTFTLSLPADATSTQLTEPLAPSKAEGPKATQAVRFEAHILLAEDGPDNQRLISHYLRTAGAHVEIVDNGKAAVNAVAARSFDLLILDMQMPVMDGYAAAAAIRAKGITIPIIALTAHAMSGDREKCIECGCDDYLSKPVDRARFVALCAHWAAERKIQAAA